MPPPALRAGLAGAAPLGKGGVTAADTSPRDGAAGVAGGAEGTGGGAEPDFFLKKLNIN
jgi:hypothetical protein